MRVMEVGEKPRDGGLYILKNQSIPIFKELATMIEWGEHSKPCGRIPQNKPFLFVRSVFEVKEPMELKHVWFQVVCGEMTGICYNGQIPFHQFLVVVDDSSMLWTEEMFKERNREHPLRDR